MYSNGTSLNVALLIRMPFDTRITLQLLGVKLSPCTVTSLLDTMYAIKTKGL